MKRLFLCALLVATMLEAQEAPFSRGVNLTGWFQTAGPRQIQFTRFTRQDLVDIQRLGADVIRLPINLHAMTDGAPDYTVDPLFFFFLDQVIDWTEELGIHLIIENHSFSVTEDTSPTIGDILVPVWTQVAARYSDRSALVYYEIFNEPHGIADDVWNAIQGRVIEAIRRVDTRHTIVVGPAGWNSYNNLRFMPTYADDNLIYTFHFYDPFIFTHQGATWVTPSLASLAGVPFPYDAARMPEVPMALNTSWVPGALRDYRVQGTAERVKDLIDIAVDFRDTRGVRVYCGEFGVYIPNSDPQDRVAWYGLVRSYLEEKGIPWTIWDYRAGFGLFEAGTDEQFEFDLNVPLLEALGLEVPPQREYVQTPETAGFELYGDFIGAGAFEAGYTLGGGLDYYAVERPASGEYAMHWSGVDQYGTVGFDFRPNKDLSRLVAEGYAVDLWVRGDTPGTSFDIRFVDTNEAGEDLPWRMRYTIDESVATWDGQWRRLRIPLRDFSEHGAWDGEWFEPRGLFDWTATDRFDIVAEHHDLQGINFWFDEIRVVGPAGTAVADAGQTVPDDFELYPNYPNPFNPRTAIRYRLGREAAVVLEVYDVAGQRVRVLEEGWKGVGLHGVEWDGTDEGGRGVGSGVYLLRVQAGGDVAGMKMMLVR